MTKHSTAQSVEQESLCYCGSELLLKELKIGATESKCFVVVPKKLAK